MKWIIIILILLSGWYLFLGNKASYSKQRAHDAAVEKLATIANARAMVGPATVPEDLRKVLGAEKLPRVKLPPPVSLSSPERFPVVVFEWAPLQPEKENTEYGGHLLLESMRTAKSNEQVLLILSPDLSSILGIISTAASSGGRGEFIGLNVVVVSDQESLDLVNTAFGSSGAISHSTSYR